MMNTQNMQDQSQAPYNQPSYSQMQTQSNPQLANNSLTANDFA